MKRFPMLALIAAIPICLGVSSCSNSSGDDDTGSTASITAFSFSSPAAGGVISESNHVISAIVPFGTDVTALVPTIAHSGESISPASGTAQDFTGPVTYTLMGKDGSAQAYVATVSVMAESTKAITSFYFNSPAATGVIDETDHSIAITVPNLTTLTALVPTIIHTGASITPASGAARDFTNPVTYIVRAKNASIQTYTVRVSVVQPVAARTTAIVGNLGLSEYVAGTTIRAAGEATGEIASPVSERGICWNTTGSPTVADSHVASGSGYGAFTGDMTGLAENTLYHVRAYVVNGLGTSYGNEITVNSGWAFGATQRYGGYVLYNDGTGHGMIVAALTDAAGYNRLLWYNSVFATGVTAQGIGMGKSNTTALLAQLPAPGTAVKFCDAYSSGSYDDWYLPSLDEVGLMYSNYWSKGLGNFTQTMYWSSCELTGASGAGYAHTGYFSTSFAHGTNDKSDSVSAYVRPVRDF